MKTYVKCAYCGKRYSVQQEHDCCPHCGAFNEFELKKPIVNKNTNKEGSIFKQILNGIWKWFKGLKLRYKLLTIFLVINIVPGIIFGIIDTIDYQIWESQQRDYTFYYNSSLLEEPTAYLGGKNNYSYERDWNVDVTVYGTFDELYEYVYKNLIKDQFNSMEYTLSSSGEVDYKDSTIYIDLLSFDLSSYSSGIYLDYEIEGNDVPSSMKMYLCAGEDIKDRLTMPSYEDEYKNLSDYLFSQKSNGHERLDLNASDIVKYEYLLIEMDDEIHKIDLKYDEDLEVSIRYYGYKTRED